MFPVDPAVQANSLRVPEPHPPSIQQETSNQPFHSIISRDASQEWTYHKTDDSQHPDGNEQQMMWLMNRARSNPHEEGLWLSATGDDWVEGAIAKFGVDLDLLQTEFDKYPNKPPAAFDKRLYDAAKAHCDDLIDRHTQDHVGQGALITLMGFSFDPYARLIAFSYAKSALYGYAGFNIDWGDDGGSGSGVQKDRGHRLTIMSVDNPSTDVVENSDTNVGLAVVPCDDNCEDPDDPDNPDKKVGPLVIAGDSCHADTSKDNHYNRFLVGTVWQDTNGNNLYDPGEGMAGITVTPDNGTYYAITANSGGYAIPMTSAGTYNVTFHGPGIDPDVTLPTIKVEEQSVLVDLPYKGLAQVITDDASDITTDTATLNGLIVTYGRATDYYFEYGTTTAYGTPSPQGSCSADSPATFDATDLSEDTLYHFRLVAINSYGTSYGIDKTFQTPTPVPLPPEATTGKASEIDTNAAYLSGSVVSHGQDTDFYFEYGATTAYGKQTASDSILQDSNVTLPVSGLADDTPYHFRLVASNPWGTDYGDDQTFRTSPLPPRAVTGSASDLTANAASLNGSIVTHGQATNYYFQYGTTTAYGTDTSLKTVAADSDVTTPISGLAADTIYHFRLVASKSQGTDPSYGGDQAFKTSTATTPGNTPPSTSSGGGGGGGGCFLQTVLHHDP